jgi:hypothetical protein
MASPFDDYQKPVSDYFIKPFPSKWTVKIGTESKNDDGISLKTTSTRSIKQTKPTQQNEVATDYEDYESVIEPKLESNGYTVEAKLSTRHLLSLTGSKQDILADGVKLSVQVEQEVGITKNEPDVQQTFTLGGEYRHDMISGKVSFGYPLEARPYSLKGYVLVKPHDQVVFGGKFDLKVSNEDKELETELVGEIKVAGSFGDTEGHIIGSQDKTTTRFARVNVLHKINDSQSAGVSTGLEFPSKAGAATKFDLNVASNWKANSKTSIAGKLALASPVQNAKFDAASVKLSLGLTQQINSRTTATIGADIDVGSVIGAKKGPNSLGLEVKLK